MNLKKIANIKNITCLCVVLALGAGILIAEKKTDPALNIDSKADSKNSVSSSSDGSSDKDERDTVILSAEIPELSCGAVDFDGNVIFADPAGTYSFMENGSNTNGITVKDDNGEDIFFSLEGGNLEIKRGDVPASGFIYKKHMVELKDGKLYFDSSPVEYKATSFSSYKLTDDYTVECTAKGQYRIKDKDGNYSDSCTIKESTGSTIKITADESGFYAEGKDDGLFYNVFRLRDDILLTSWSYVLYINGEELVPYGYSDKYKNPDIVIDADKVTLEPMEPPVDYGAAATSNEGISAMTEEMLGYVNEVRARYDMPPVYGLDELDAASATRAEELAQKFDHTRPDEKESSYTTAVSKAGLIWWRSGENIAKGGTSVKEVFDSWISSQEHRAIILDPDMKYLSLSSFNDGTDTYWDLLMFNDCYVPIEEEE